MIASTIPELSPNCTIESPKQDEMEEMVRWITADVLNDHYGVITPPGDFYSLEDKLWLLLTALDSRAPGMPTTLLMRLENLHTLVKTTETLCLLLTYYFRGRCICQDGLQRMAIVISRQSKINLNDSQTHRLSRPVSVLDASDSVDNWSNMNADKRKHSRSIWPDESANMAFLTTEP